MTGILGGSANADDAPLLLETREAAYVLGVGSTMVRKYVDQGLLRLAARTRRGCRLFEYEACRALAVHLGREPVNLE